MYTHQLKQGPNFVWDNGGNIPTLDGSTVQAGEAAGLYGAPWIRIAIRGRFADPD